MIIFLLFFYPTRQIQANGEHFLILRLLIIKINWNFHGSAYAAKFNLYLRWLDFHSPLVVVALNVESDVTVDYIEDSFFFQTMQAFMLIYKLENAKSLDFYCYVVTQQEYVEWGIQASD